MKKTRRGGERRPTILLKDLDPGKEVRGGAGKRLFGEPADAFDTRPESNGNRAEGPVVEEPSTEKRSR